VGTLNNNGNFAVAQTAWVNVIQAVQHTNEQ